MNKTSFHRYAHGIWDGYSLAFARLIRLGMVDAAAALDARQARIVNDEVRAQGRLRGVDPEELRQLMLHHGRRGAKE